MPRINRYHKEWVSSIEKSFAESIKGRRFQPSRKSAIRARARVCFAAAIGGSISSEVLRERYARTLESSVYYLTSCCVDRRYLLKIRDIRANLRRNANYIVKSYAPELVPLLPNLMLARGGPGHLRRLHSMLACYKRTPMSLADRQRMDNEIEVYRARDPALWTSLSSTIAGLFEGSPEDDHPDGPVQCKRCDSRKTTYDLLQTRSGDEGMTAFYQCRNCHSRWKG